MPTETEAPPPAHARHTLFFAVETYTGADQRFYDEPEEVQGRMIAEKLLAERWATIDDAELQRSDYCIGTPTGCYFRILNRALDLKSIPYPGPSAT